MKRTFIFLITVIFSVVTFAEIPNYIYNEFWDEYNRIEYSNRKFYGDYNTYHPGYADKIDNTIKQTEQVYFVGMIKNDTVYFTNNDSILFSEPIIDWYSSERAAKNDNVTNKRNIERKNTFVIGTNKRYLKATRLEDNCLLQLERI